MPMDASYILCVHSQLRREVLHEYRTYTRTFGPLPLLCTIYITRPLHAKRYTQRQTAVLLFRAVCSCAVAGEKKTYAKITNGCCDARDFYVKWHVNVRHHQILHSSSLFWINIFLNHSNEIKYPKKEMNIK